MRYATTPSCYSAKLSILLPARRYASADTSYGPVSVSVCVCLSVTSRCSVKRHEQINLLFGIEASSDQAYTVI